MRQRQVFFPFFSSTVRAPVLRRYGLGLALLLAACSPPPRPPVTEPACPPCPTATPCASCAPCPTCLPCAATETTKAPTPTFEVARWEALPGWREDRLQEAWSAWLASCAALQKRGSEAWRAACARTPEVDGRNGRAVRAYFERNFTPHAVVEGDGAREGLITGYYEPLLRGSRQRDAKNTVPVLGVPDDLLTIDLGSLYPELKYKRLRGRLEGNKVVPYADRAELEADIARGDFPAAPLLWVDDPVEFFFLQIQGSGRVELADGRRVRIGYADQNGHPYRSIGRLLVARGELKLEEASMQGIQAWGRAHPERLRALLNENPSYVFFRELASDSSRGPQGALGVPLTPERSLAVDPRVIPLGAPVWLDTTRPNRSDPLQRLMLAQDTGGAIVGGVRADFFWGFGRAAGEQAGRMRQKGRLWVLLPNDPATVPNDPQP